jgi:hypothetical protein
MARPMGVARATKDNSNKHPRQAEEFREGKKIGRPKQRWVVDSTTVHEGVTMTQGHWEKVTNG